MSHIHIPDGIIAVWLWLLGYAVVAVYFIIFSVHIKKTSDYKKITLVSVLGALMLLSMSLPVPFVIPYHLNLSALTGILVGPLYAGAAIFSVNLILALVGHGGITIVGLNTVVLTIEAAIAYFLFKFLKQRFKKSFFWPAFLATYPALIISALITIGVIYLGTQNLEFMLHCHECHGCAGHHDHAAAFDPQRFLLLIFAAGAFGWTLEAIITGFIVNYISRVKPDLLEGQD